MSNFGLHFSLKININTFDIILSQCDNLNIFETIFSAILKYKYYEINVRIQVLIRLFKYFKHKNRRKKLIINTQVFYDYIAFFLRLKS